MTRRMVEFVQALTPFSHDHKGSPEVGVGIRIVAADGLGGESCTPWSWERSFHIVPKIVP